MSGRLLLQKQVEAWGLPLSTGELEILMSYAELLEHYNLANVIGTRDHYRIIADHIVDSLSCLLTGLVTDDCNLADVGTGAGLPGMPLKIATAPLEVTFVESTGKKARFLEHAVATLGLDNIQIFNSRVEEYGRSARHVPPHDLATARALAPLSVLAEYCLPLLKVGGYILAMKARLREEELHTGRRAASLLGARIEEIIRVPHISEIGPRERRLVVVKKVRPTPAGYPRRVGVPRSHPLG